MIEIYRALVAVVNSEGALVTSPWKNHERWDIHQPLLGKATAMDGGMG
jgi:hypothetical protein